MLKYVILFKNERSKLIEMIQTIFYALVNKQLQNEIVTSEDEKIYRYGYILLCEVILNHKVIFDYLFKSSYMPV